MKYQISNLLSYKLKYLYCAFLLIVTLKIFIIATFNMPRSVLCFGK